MLTPMLDWLTKKAGRWAIKEALAVGFFLCCGLAKMFPIFDDGNYQADAILYMLLFGLAYFGWEAAR